MRSEDIISFARGLRDHLGTNDPEIIAVLYGIKVLYRWNNPDVFKAHTIKMDGYPTIITVNERFSEVSRKMLCAHELGHALLHEDTINHFDITSRNILTNVEYEANLFAVALLFDESDFSLPFSKMSNSVLKSILDYNIYPEV